MRTVLSLMLSVVLMAMISSCKPEDSSSMSVKITLAELEELYAKHKKNMETQLRDGKSWLMCDEKNVTKLANAVPSHLDFFQLKVEKEFFIVEDVLHRSGLYKTHQKALARFSNSRGNVEAQKTWSHILLEEKMKMRQ